MTASAASTDSQTLTRSVLGARRLSNIFLGDCAAGGWPGLPAGGSVQLSQGEPAALR